MRFLRTLRQNEVYAAVKRPVTFALIVALIAGGACQLAQRSISQKAMSDSDLGFHESSTSTATHAPAIASPTAPPTIAPITTPTAAPTRRPSPTARPAPTKTQSPAPSKNETPTPTPEPSDRPLARQTASPTVGVAPPVATAETEVISPALTKIVRDSLRDKQGTYGVAIKHLVTGEIVLMNADRQFEAASLYKLPVMFEAFKQCREGEVSFTEEVTVTEKAATFYEDGEPTMPVGSTVTIGEAVERMITASDNTAAHVLLERLQAWRINQTTKALGLGQTEILDGVRTSPADMMRLLELIATEKAVDAEASRTMIQLLQNQQVRDRLPRFLPPGTDVANKTGNWDGVRHDVGIVYGPSGPYVIAVLAEGLDDGEEAVNAIAQLSYAVYDHFNPSRSQPPVR